MANVEAFPGWSSNIDLRIYKVGDVISNYPCWDFTRSEKYFLDALVLAILDYGYIEILINNKVKRIRVSGNVLRGYHESVRK